MKKTVLVLIVGALLGAAIVRFVFPPAGGKAGGEKGHEEGEKGHDHGGHDHGKGEGKEQKDQEEGTVKLDEDARKSVGIRAVQIQRQKLGASLTATAVVRPVADQLAHVSPKVAGKVHSIKAVQGTEVKQGDPLLVLDSIDVGNAAADYLKAKASLEVAKVNFDREEELFKRNATRGADFYEAKGQHIRSQAEYQATRGKLIILGWPKERVDTLKWDDPDGLSKVTIFAPVDGEVIEKHATLGEVVTPETNLFTITNLSSVWVSIDLYQKDFRKVHKDQPVEATCDSHPGKVFKGRITYVGKVLVEETRTLEARVELDNKAGLLQPGMYVTAHLADNEDEHAKEVLAVPLSSIQRVGEVPVVFVAKAPGVYERRAVTLGQRYGDRQEVLVGLEAGVMVVTEGSFTLKSELLRSQMGHGHAH